MTDNWTFDQLCLQVWKWIHPQEVPDWLGILASYGPARTKEGCYAKERNFVFLSGNSNSQGLRNTGRLDPVALGFRLNQPLAFDRYCRRLISKARRGPVPTT